MDEQLEASRRDALCKQAHAWLEVGGEADGDVVVTRERCVHCGEERTTETPRGLSALIALLAVLLLSACAASHGRIEGPPLYVHLCHEMPAADAEAWGEAAGALNRELEAAALWVGHGEPRGCDTVDVCPSDDVLADAETHVGTCVVTVRYAPGTAREVATQELDALLGRMP